MTDEPRDHVIRENLPWRTEQITECGRLVNDVASAITREQLAWRVKQYGQQRTAFTVCMTCYGTANHAPRWETNPAQSLSRNHRGRGSLVYYEYDRTTGSRSGPYVDQLGAELHAIAALIDAHRDEFDQRVNAAREAALFAERRRIAQRKTAT